MAECSIRQEWGWRQGFLWLVVCGAFLAAYLPAVTNLVRAWSQSEDHSYGFAIVPLAAYLVWSRRAVLRETPVRGSWVGLLVATGSLALYLAAAKGGVQTLVSLSMVFFLWGAVIFLFGFALFRACLFPLLFLLLMVPVPSQITALLTIPLQLLVTKVSIWLAALIGTPVYSEGNIINLPRGSFEVVQACSGLRSIMTMLTLGALIAFLTLRSTALRVVLFLSAVPIAIAVNILRVFTLIATFHFLGLDLSQGPIHTVLGLAVFGMALGLFLLIRKGLALCEP